MNEADYNVVPFEMDLSRRERILAKRKVAAYARVSTNQEEQQSSYATEVDCYRRRKEYRLLHSIKQNPSEGIHTEGYQLGRFKVSILVFLMEF